ncbi:enolase C-terminal domain-like protein [Agromyces sp. H66]|uniref:mandelate racemase/muconate lactonizing enzyme family protein n=1 Tax=Agromyces sp. H66 TaxID=2529859 RepID=UPI0010AAC3EC|nr:enolase C-terminal domain-like protein [Agromyces sp. H66]
MSTLAELRVHRVPSPLVRPFVTAIRRAEHLDVLLVEAVDADGRSGWGEAPTSWRVTGESPESVRAAVTGPLAEAVIGVPTAERERWSTAIAAALIGNSAARSAVECALTDLAAQTAGCRVADLLGAAPGVDRVRTDMTLSAGSAEDLVAWARGHVDDGFGCLKVKVSANEAALPALVALRAELGPVMALRVDANQAFTPSAAIRFIRDAEDAGIDLELVEQPVAAADLDGLALVTAAVDTPILADESVWTTHDLRRVVRRRAADLVNVKLAKTGGPTEALRLAAEAVANGVGVVVGCMMESTVGVASAASLAAAIRPGAVHDLDAGLWLHDSPVAGGLRYAGEHAVLGDGLGLGIRALSGRVAA